MEREISSGATLGVVLIALAAVIGLGFGVFAIAKGTANDGVTNVQDSLQAAGKSIFQDYDQHVVTGTQVLSAFQSFQGKDVAILVSTLGLQTKNIKGFNRTAATPPYGVLRKIGGAVQTHPKAAKGMNYETFMNYNALLANATGVPVRFTGGATATGEAAGLTAGPEVDLQNGSYIASYGIALDTGGNMQFDNDTERISKSGDQEYIATSAKFNSNLVKDSSGTIIGIAFTQIP